MSAKRIVSQAIHDSILRDAIVTIDGSEDICDELRSRSDDYAEIGVPEREYWGRDEEGDAWRVHVRMGD